MSNQAYSMEDLRKRVEENAVATMGALMPAEHLSQLVNASIDKFFNDAEAYELFSTENSSYGYTSSQTKAKVKCTPFDLIVWRKIQPIITKYLDEILSSENNEITASLEAEHAKIIDAIKSKTLVTAVKVAPHLQEYFALSNLAQSQNQLISMLQQTFYSNRMESGIIGNFRQTEANILYVQKQAFDKKQR